jgi:hypothetical protein
VSARIPPGFAEVWTQLNVSGDQEAMYFSLGVDLAVGVGATQTAADNLLIAVRDAIDNVVSNLYTLGPGHVLFGQDGGDIRIDGTTAPVAGVGAGEPLPPNCAVLYRKNTTAGGRRGRGRFFVPGAPESSVDKVGTLLGSYMVIAQAAGVNIINNVTATAEAEGLVLFHDTAPFTPTPITALEPQSRLATQRRRLRP